MMKNRHDQSKRRVPALLYHMIGEPPAGARNPRSWVSTQRFAWQMRHLAARGYRAITPGRLADHYRGVREADPGSLLITFDDGSRTCLNAALPVLRGLGWTATVFLVSGRLGGRAEWDATAEHGGDELLSIEEIRELIRSGWSVGAHSVSHERLTRLSADRAREEIRASKLDLEQTLSAPVTTFAYPYGAYAPEHAALVCEAGYDLGFTTHYPEGGLYAIGRETIHGKVHAFRFLWRFQRARRGRFQGGPPG